MNAFLLPVQGHRLLRLHLLTLVVLQGLLYLLPLVAVPYMLRVLGNEGFGRFAFVMGIAQYFVLLTDYGFQLSASRRAGIMHDNPDALATLLTSVSLIRLSLCLIGALGVLVVSALSTTVRQNADVFWLAYVTVLGNALMPTWFLQGIGRLQVATVCLVCGQALSLIALMLWVHAPEDYPLAVLSQSCATFVAAVLAWSFLAGTGRARLRRPASTQIGQVWREGWSVFISGAATHLYTTSNTVLLGLVAAPTAVGQFAAADKIVRAAQGLFAPVSQAIYPHVARLAAESRSSALAFLYRMLRWQAVLTLALSATLLGLSDYLVAWVYGASEPETTKALQWLALLPLLVGVSNVFGTQTLLNFDLRQPFNRVLIFSGLVNVPLVLLWGWHYGPSGASAAVLVTEGVVVLLLAVSLQKSGLLRSLLVKEKA